MADDYLIWSHEHGAWWGPHRCGYVPRVSEAGRYSHAEALDICARAIPGTAIVLGRLPELPVRLADVEAMQQAFHRTYAVPPDVWE